MFYVVAVALLDGEVYPDQLTPERIRKPDVQHLLKLIDVETGLPLHKPVGMVGVLDPYTRGYPEKLRTGITIHLKGGKKISHEKDDYYGYYTNPMSWKDAEQKFNRLAGDNANSATREKIIAVIKNLENESADQLIEVLAFQHTDS